MEEGKKHDRGKTRVNLLPSRLRVNALMSSEVPDCSIRSLARYLETGCYEMGFKAACLRLGEGCVVQGILGVAQVMEYGAQKYGEQNWRLVSANRYLDAAWRHLASSSRGSAKDEESGLPHLAHLGANFAILASLGRP